MLFNSYAFIFLFLPIVLIGFFVLSRYHLTTAAALWLVLASLAFYGYWSPVYVLFLLSSILVNFYLGQAIERHRGLPHLGRSLLVLGIGLNLSALGYFKYANFFIGTVNDVLSTHWSLGTIILPLGISFFTFTQLAYLVDAYRGQIGQYRLLTYALFVTFFPHLIAGPILYHKDIIPQFQQLRTYVLSQKNLARGFLLFAIGLFKKVVIADSLSSRVGPVFDHPLDATIIDAWVGALGYTMQLYFDFSGYSDMAIGLGYMLNVRLPINFNSPYKATSIIDFWRRWHMTLAWFLRNYLYFPLGGNRRGRARQIINILTTMLLCGLWHGAGWTFIAWGALQGCYLTVNHTWRKLNMTLPTWLAWGLTFGSIVAGWVLFRARNMEEGIVLLKTMVGAKGIDFPTKYQPLLGGLSHLGVRFADSTLMGYPIDHLGGLLIWIVLVVTLPNSIELVRRFQPTWRWTIFAGVAAGYALVLLRRPSEFLYFQF